MTEKMFTARMVECPSCKARTFYQDHAWKLVCVSCYLASKAATSTAPALPTAIAPDMLRRLIQLCHPDKHNDSEASNTATRYLLELKGAAHG